MVTLNKLRRAAEGFAVMFIGQKPANEALSNSEYATPEQKGGTGNMGNQSFTKSNPGSGKVGVRKSKEPTAFSKAFPPKHHTLPDEYKTMLTWSPTEKLRPVSYKPTAKKAK